jgi:cation transport ATPase
VLALPAARWALAALVLFLIALPLNLLGAPAWLWGPLFAATYITGGWEPGWEGVKALKDKTLDVDLLMVATARTADSVRGLLDLAPATAARLVPGERHGRSIVYALYDNHVAELLDQALYHVEHLRLGVRDVPAGLAEPAVAD